MILPEKLAGFMQNGFLVIGESRFRTNRVAKMHQFMNDCRFLIATRKSGRDIVVLFTKNTDASRLCGERPKLYRQRSHHRFHQYLLW
jgi:hypothetical protein